CMQALEFPLIF
nr:immunoglobulin light chain junction region [Macaca mulatta]MOV86013.1 immunoglobulin light chain junction region [Macaca mulatta]